MSMIKELKEKLNNHCSKWFTRQKFPRQFSGGFTLIELMVSLTLFVIVIMAAISSLYSVNQASRKVEAMRTVLDNLNFAIESMSRTIRTGTDVGCEGVAQRNCEFGDSPSSVITVNKTIGTSEVVTYGYDTDAVTGRGFIERCAGGTCIPITAPGINVRNLSFFVEGADEDPPNILQPKVLMIIEGIATAGENTAPFVVQTQVSVRSAE
jgi:prepilin-type N-terminal cleavage/methylation domain-containing protein